MRTMDCQKLRREVDEAAPGDLLSSFGSRHLSGCLDCKTFSEQHHKLRDILSNLGTVAAPGDFDFRLRSRLAREKAGSARFQLSNLSVGSRAAIVATLLVVFGSAVLFSFKTSPDSSTSSNRVNPAAVVDNGSHAAGAATKVNSGQFAAVEASPLKQPRDAAMAPKRRAGAGSAAIALARNTPRMGIRDLGTTPARLIKTADLSARFADFPIESSSQPMTLSWDNGRGSWRTISLPPVSFGSQRALSQGAPLMASARRSW